MDTNYLRRLRRRARKIDIVIHKDRVHGGYLLLDPPGNYVIEAVNDLIDAERRIVWEEERARCNEL